MASTASDVPELAAILSRATTRSRWVAIVALLGILAVMASLVTLYILAENRAELAERREVVARENARSISDQLERIRSAYARGDTARVGIELGVAVTKAEDLTENPNQTLAATPVDLTRREALEIANEQLVYDLPAKDAAFRQDVYIHFVGNLTRAQITALNQALRNSGWAMQGPSGERLASADGLNEVRYSGSNEAAATALAAAITKAGITSAPVSARKLDIIHSGVLEVWISG